MKLKVTEVKYTKKFNTGNYESEEYSLTASLESKENPLEVIAELKAQVLQAKSGEAATSEEEDEEEDEEETTPKSKAKSKAEDESEEDESEDEEETEDEESEDDSDDTDEEDESEDEEEESEEEAEEEEEKPKAKAKKAAPKATKFKSKPQGYTRSDRVHKELLGKTLSAVWPDWKKNPKNKDKALKVSKKLEGVAFLDEKGQVLKSFKDALKKALK